MHIALEVEESDWAELEWAAVAAVKVVAPTDLVMVVAMEAAMEAGVWAVVEVAAVGLVVEEALASWVAGLVTVEVAERVEGDSFSGHYRLSCLP